MDHKMKQGALVSYLAIAFNVVSVLLYAPLLIQGLGNSDYAVYTLVYSFLNYFVIDFGIGSSVARFITEFRYNKNEKYSEQQLLAVVFKVFFLLTLCVGIFLVGLYPFLDKIFKGLTAAELIQLRKVYGIAVVYTLAMFIATPLESIFVANEFFAVFKLCKLLQKMGTILLTVIFLFMSKGLVWVMMAGAVSGVVTVVSEIFYLMHKDAIKIDWRYWDGCLLKKVLGFSLWMAVVTFAQRLIIPITPTILGIVSSSLEISIFSIATHLEGYVFMFAAALNGLFLPKVSRLVNSGQRKELNSLQVKMGRIQLFIIGTLLSGATVFGKEFIVLWVGSEYIKAYYVFLLISLSDIVYLTQEIASTTLTVIGEVRYRAIVYVVGAALSITLSFLLASHFGAIGSAVAIAICLWGFNVGLMTFIYHKKAQVDMKTFFLNCHLKIMPIYLVYGGLWLIINAFLPTGTWLALIGKCMAFVVILFPIMWVKVLNPQEKGWLNSLARKVVKGFGE